MDVVINDTVNLMRLLPQEDVTLINALARKLVKAWDPDFTRITKDEAKQIEDALDEMNHNIYYSEDDVWS